ncbi:ABC transporter permease [Mesobacillus campisalis]|uniref:ABC transporter permease n=1 Tax=Mesobacillus campisalis TaxID=1408103 RepID=UPI00069C6606|nr:ABC transporter permease [Mesobacillus campisalis]
MKTMIFLEFYKLRCTRIVLTTTVLTLFALLQGWQFAKLDRAREAEDIFRAFLYQGSMSVYSWLIFPLIITVVLAMMARLEHSQNGWKQLLALPVSRGVVYGAKLLVGMTVISYSLILLYAGLIVAAHFLGVDNIPYLWMMKRLLVLFLASLAIIGILFYLSFQFAHVAVPMAVGAGLAFPSMLVANSEKYWIFYPWDYPIVASMNYVFDMGGNNLHMLGVSVLIFCTFVFIGFSSFCRKDIL